MRPFCIVDNTCVAHYLGVCCQSFKNATISSRSLSEKLNPFNEMAGETNPSLGPDDQLWQGNDKKRRFGIECDGYFARIL